MTVRVLVADDHEPFRGAARSLAHLFDVAADPANRELMTYPSPATGGPVLRCYHIPKTATDLASRRAMSARWAEDTCRLNVDPLSLSTEAPHRTHLNCSSTNHFLSLREQFLKWPGASGGWPVGGGKFQWPGPPQLPFCEPENVRFRLRFIFLAVTA